MTVWAAERYRRLLSGREGLTNLATVAAVALGTVLLSKGLKEWRVVVWAEEAVWSRGPAHYRQRMDEVAGLARQAGLEGQWLAVVVSTDADAPTCRQALARLGPNAASHRIAVLRLVSGRVGVSTAVDARAGSAKPPADALCATAGRAAIQRDTLDRMASGFFVLDSSAHVVYSSRHVGDLGRVTSVLTLFEHGP